jgi:hypothetical protein
MPSRIVDCDQLLITDLRHENRDETDVIMTQIREKNFQRDGMTAGTAAGAAIR